MDFSFTREQVMLRDGVQRFLRENYGFEACRRIVESPAGHSAQVWAQIAALQWLALPFTEADGGLDGGAVEILLLAEQFGRALCVEPYLANIVLAGQLVARLGTPAQRAALLPGLIDGSRQASLAHQEAAGRHRWRHCETRARAHAGGFVLDGRKSLVLNGPNAGTLIVLARHAGAVDDAHGLGLFVVDAQARGVSRRDYAVLGGGVACELMLDQVVARGTLGMDAAAIDTLEDVLDLAIAASCAEAFGAMQALLERTAEYLKTRKQFGAALGSFQVLQHRAVDMFVEIQQSQSMILMAMLKLQDADRAVRQRAVSACKAYLHQASRFVAQQAVQLHGGIGVTEELAVGHYFRRLTAFGNLFGDREFHLQRFAALAPAEAA